MSFFRNLAGVLLTTAVIAPVGMATSILLARYLSTDDRGLYALALSFATLTTMFFQLGWPTASIFRLRGAGSDPAEVSGAAFLFFASTFGVVVVVAIALEPLLRDRLLGGLPAIGFFLVLATVPFRGFANAFGAIARGIDRFRYENWYAFALQVGSLGAVVGALVLHPGGLIELLAAMTGVYVLLVVGLIVAVVRQTGFRLRVRPREMQRSFRFGLKTYAMTLSARTQERADFFLLAWLLEDPSQVAYFAIAKGGIQLVKLLPNALGKVAYPQLAGLGVDEAAHFACGLARQGILFMVPAALVLLVLAPWLLPTVYGEPYAASIVPFLIMLPSVVLNGTERVLARFFTGTNQHKPNVITRAISLLVNVVLNLLWIPSYGIAGSAAALLVSSVFDAVILTGVFLWMTDCRLLDLLRLRGEDFEPYRRQLERISGRLRPTASRAPR